MEQIRTLRPSWACPRRSPSTACWSSASTTRSGRSESVAIKKVNRGTLTGYRGRASVAREPRPSSFCWRFCSRARLPPQRGARAVTAPRRVRPRGCRHGPGARARVRRPPSRDASRRGGSGGARPDRRLRARRRARRSRRAAAGAAAPSVAPIGEPFVESGAERSDRQAAGHAFRGSPRRWTAIGYRASVSHAPRRRRRDAGRRAERLRPRPLRVRRPATGRSARTRSSGASPSAPAARCRRAGAERTAALERERGRVIDFLRSEGYFEANVRLDAGRPATDARRGRPRTSRIDTGPAIRSGRSRSRQPRHPDRGDRSDVPARRRW